MPLKIGKDGQRVIWKRDHAPFDDPHKSRASAFHADFRIRTSSWKPKRARLLLAGRPRSAAFLQAELLASRSSRAAGPRNKGREFRGDEIQASLLPDSGGPAFSANCNGPRSDQRQRHFHTARAMAPKTLNSGPNIQVRKCFTRHFWTISVYLEGCPNTKARDVFSRCEFPSS